MHDPLTVAFDIKRPWPRITIHDVERRLYGRFYWPTIITIWHCDPERDGTDDSCGWFQRARHGDKATLERIVKAFKSEWKDWFDDNESPKMSTPSIVLDMFTRAVQQVYMHRVFDRHGWRGATRFCSRNLYDILRFAGNGTDSFHTFIESVYGKDASREERIERASEIVYGWILRAERPWYRHPRWHIHHWRIQIHVLQTFKRWAFSRCAGCGRRFAWGYAPTSFSWDGDGPRWFVGERGVYHSGCTNQSESVKET